MATYIKYGETIEGDAVDIQVRKWTPGTIVDLPSVKKKMYRYSSDRNSQAIVKKAHIVSDDPEIIEATKDYHRGIGDTLSCDGMKVYIDSFKQIKVKPDEGASHRHGANFASTSNHTIATISTPLVCLQKAIAEKDAEVQKLIGQDKK